MKMAVTSQKQIDNLELLQKRMEIIVGARLRSVDKIKKAVYLQDRIRQKTQHWNGAEEIRKWREKKQS